MRLYRMHAFYRRLMYRRSGIAMLAVLLTLIMIGPYACIKIDMIETKEKIEQNERGKGLISLAAWKSAEAASEKLWKTARCKFRL